MVGAGSMGEAVIAGLLRAGWTTADLHVVVRRDERIAELRDRHGIEPADLAVAAKADVVVLATKPAQILPLLDELSPLIDAGSGSVVASLAAGIPVAAMQRRLKHGVPIVRVMPNTPALVGEGMSVISGGVYARDEHIVRVEQVMGAVGTTMRLPENLQDAAGAMSGAGPAYVFYVVDAMAEAGVLMGLPRATALELAVRTMTGSAALLAETGTHPVLLREQVTSPAGTTIAALRVLDQRAVRAAFLDALCAARDRSLEIGGNLEAP